MTKQKDKDASSGANRKNGQEEYLGQITGVKLVHELMVDIMGGLIPGVLFLFSVIVCVVLPLICYHGLPRLIDDGGYAKGWFWMVVFMTFLILSYVIGHIFYRSDIKDPDKADLRRQRTKFLNTFRRDLERATNPSSEKQRTKSASRDTQMMKNQIKFVARILKTEIEYLRSALEAAIDEHVDLGSTEDFGKMLCEACRKSEAYLDGVIAGSYGQDSFYNKYVLCILFPEEERLLDACEEDKCARDRLPVRSRTVLDEYEKLLAGLGRRGGGRWSRRGKNPERSFLLSLAVCYNVLFVQNEVGCSTESRCDFPYISYYKYLLKRHETELLKYVHWNTTNERTKNKINKYKIQIQMFASNAYAILNKNESHIRMAASSWYVAKTMKIVALVMMVVTVIPVVIHFSLDFEMQGVESILRNTLDLFRAETSMQRFLIAFSFPVSIFALLSLLKRKIITFIHYQRLREIYYVLSTYHEWKSNLEEAMSDQEKLLKLRVKRAELDLCRTYSETADAMP